MASAVTCFSRSEIFLSFTLRIKSLARSSGTPMFLKAFNTNTINTYMYMALLDLQMNTSKAMNQNKFALGAFLIYLKLLTP